MLPTQVPQSEPLSPDQVENSAGGHVWRADDWTRLRRFLILGSEGGSYYASERKLTRENARAVACCLALNARRTVDTIVSVSEHGLAPRNDPAIFALALAAGAADPAVRRLALDALPRVCRTGTHLFQFVEYVKSVRGWGRQLRRAVGAWYEAKDPASLAYQLVKYRQREGWSHRDLLRLSHPPGASRWRAALYRWASGHDIDEGSRIPRLVEGFLLAQASTCTARRAADLVREYGLPREALRPEHLSSWEVWDALFEKMPMTAMIRNLATMTRVGLLTPTGDLTAEVCSRLTDGERLRKARIHPIQALAALVTYQAGHGARGQHVWEPLAEIVDALDAAFYACFGNVEPTGKRLMLALDVSGSMGWGAVSGVPGLTPRVAAAAMALVTANAEDRYEVVAFSRQLVPMTISPRQRLDDVVRTTDRIPYGATDCALPMLYAREQGREVDAFVVYTDSETWCGDVHPTVALEQYRRESGIPARLAVVGMVSNGFTIADPSDPGMLDVVGFDTSAPNILSSFVRGDV